MKKIDSDALWMANRALGLTGAGLQATELLDGQVNQTLDIGRVARRSRALVGTEGVFYGILQNVHTDIETLTTTYSVYTATGANVAPFPSPIPAQFDLWLLTAGIRRISGVGGLTNGVFFINLLTGSQAFGIDDSGVAIVSTIRHVLASWDTITVITPVSYGIQENGDALSRIGLRLPRGDVQLGFSSTSAATATFNLELVFGLFPVTLGQDALI